MVIERVVTGRTPAAAVRRIKLLGLVDETETLQFPGKHTFVIIILVCLRYLKTKQKTYQGGKLQKKQ